jgi:hypothetical protein
MPREILLNSMDYVAVYMKQTVPIARLASWLEEQSIYTARRRALFACFPMVLRSFSPSSLH